MSSFIPMVSSSPPPMDDSGGFGWDDDDEFGTFTSADTSYKEAEHDSSGGWDKFDGNVQNDTNDEFADFSAFDKKALEKKTVSNKINPSDGFSPQNEQKDGHELPGDTRFSKEEISDLDFHVLSKDQEVSGGPLTDSGMYSAEISPVQDIEKQGTSPKGCEHSDSLDDVQTDSLSETADQNFDSKHQHNIATDKMTNDAKDYKENNGNVVVVDSSDSVIVQNNSSDNAGNTENKNHLCSESTDSNPESIPVQNLEHSNISKSWHNSGIIQMVESKGTNNTMYETSPSGCEITQTQLRQESDQMESSISKIEKCDLRETDDHCDKENNGSDVSEGEVKKFIDDEVISEALKRVSQSDDTEIDQLGNSDVSDLSFQKCVSENSAPAVGVQESDTNDECQNSHSASSNSIKTLTSANPSQSRGKGEVNDNTFIEDPLQSESNVSNSVINVQTESVYEKNSHNCHLSSQNSSPESSNYMKDVSESADKSDEKSNSESFDTSSGDIENNVNNETVKDENEFCDDDFGDFSANQSSQDLDFRQSSIPYNDSDTSLSQKENSADEELNDFNRVSNELCKDQVRQEEGGSYESLKQLVMSSKSETFKNDAVDNDDFGDFSVNKSNEDINENDEKLEKHSTNISENVNQFDDDEDDFGDFGDFSSGTTVMVGDSVAKDDSFANFTSETTESQDESWAAFQEPQTSTANKDLNDADDDWGAFGDEESTSDIPFKATETHHVQNAALQNMSKHEKLVYAVTSCFLDNIGSKFDKQVEDLSNAEKDNNTKSCPSDVWVQIKSLQTSREVSYQWSKSEWNSQLFTTLHIDTRNVLIGHKKAQVPIFAAGLTLLEPVKGSSDGVLKPEVLVDTNKPDSTMSQTQEAFPPAQFDWTSSGLTNPLEANNKTLNLDFLIQDKSSKSSDLESEFLKPDPPTAHKPSIQPLENILANLKTSSTYKPTTRDENISKEAQKVVQSLPNLSFMKSRVLMFPIHMDDK